MKKTTSLLLLCSIALIARSQNNVGIGTSTPNVSAQLDITSTSKGLLIPRMNSTAINAIPSPAKGLMVLDTAKNQLVFNIGTPAVPNWQSIAFSSGWSTTGNAGTDTSKNFIGTTDDKDLVFKRNNIKAGTITTDNISLGVLSLVASSGFDNVAIGQRTLNANTSGYSNIAIGTYALTLNTTGNRNIAIGSALGGNLSGDFNVAVGVSSLELNKTGTSNTAIGDGALFFATGSGNTAIGHGAGGFSGGDGSVFIGENAGKNETNSNRLYISNSNADANNALIYGEFDNRLLKVNGKLTINVAPRSVGLDIGSAAIKVSGTSPAVFTVAVVAPVLDLVIPNTSMANSSTDILIVTHRLTGSKLSSSPGAFWNGTNWVIFLENGANHVVGEQFNVMVIKQ